ncbi:MAG TPA: transcriptional repressor [Nitrospirae bacterium]|nr:transcriptional repressor [Nitrospirota bacterium]HDO22164.1 transcriptional repressor [Nitrospirota bacterium]HDZ88144.1 transcriptional repressor [Nitrospirota bacterium]
MYGAEDIFRDFLQGKDLKFTHERITVLREISRLKRHFDIEELYITLRKKDRKVSRASVYRTVPLLVESGLVEEIKTIDTHTYYEYTFGKEHHDHLICLKCGKIIEFHSEKLEHIQDEVCRKEDFSGVRHVLEIQGYCKKCG